MNISSQSTICISIAKSPGNFGANFHNSAYSILNLDWIYLPRKVESHSDLEKVIEGVRSFNIRGCSVSMPHKENVIEYLDDLDFSAKKIGAVNTILNSNDGFLKGYNTDYYGAKKALESLKISGQKIIMIGAGGAAKAIGLAVLDLGGELIIINRDNEKSKNLSKKFNCESKKFKNIDEYFGDILINATSVGMNDTEKMIVDERILDNYKVIMDVVIYPSETKLIRSAKLLNKHIIPGSLMCVYQAAEQFKIYTGLDAPDEIINSTLTNL